MMMPTPRSRRSWLLALGIGPAAVSCTELLGIDRDYAEAPATDAGSSHETSPGRESGPSDAPPPDAASGHWCEGLSPKPLFCEDFDEESLGDAWTSMTTSSASIRLDNLVSVSPPSSLYVAMPAVTTTNADAFMTAAFKQTLSGPSVFNFDMFIDNFADQVTDTHIADLKMPGGYGLDVEIDSWTHINLVEWFPKPDGAPQYELFTISAGNEIQEGTWFKFEIKTEPPSGGTGIGFVTLSMNGKVLVDREALGVLIAAGSPQIDVGVYWPHEGESEWLVHFDNVTFDLP
jgi:hypothetical protein